MSSFMMNSCLYIILFSLSYMSNTHSIQDIKDFLLILICRFFHRTTHYRLLFLLLLLLQLSSFLLFLLLTLTFLLLEILILLNSNISLHTYLSLIYTLTKLATKAGSGRTSIWPPSRTVAAKLTLGKLSRIQASAEQRQRQAVIYQWRKSWCEIKKRISLDINHAK